MAAKLIHDPEISADCIDAWDSLVKGKIFAVIMSFLEDKNSVEVTKTVNNGGTWAEILEGLDEQRVSFLGINVRFRNVAGGKREKLTYVKWVADALQRSTWKQTIQVKTVSQGIAGNLRTAFGELGPSSYPQILVEANDFSELTRDAVLDRASKNERDAVDMDSVDELMPLERKGE